MKPEVTDKEIEQAIDENTYGSGCACAEEDFEESDAKSETCKMVHEMGE